MTEPSNENELIRKIVTAFSDAEFPGNDHSVNNSYGEEPALVRLHFLGQNNWNSLSPEFMDFDGALSFFLTRHFVFLSLHL